MCMGLNIGEGLDDGGEEMIGVVYTAGYIAMSVCMLTMASYPMWVYACIVVNGMDIKPYNHERQSPFLSRPT